MQKLMSNKKIIICICAVAVVIVAAVMMLLSNKEESFRSILVYEIEGSAEIERAGAGSMNAVENLYLESGDRVIVAQDSSVRLKLDDDKYVMAEADTIFSVEAEGTAENSRTKISLEQGAVTNEIQHPLSEGSSYETSTPNSVMAVRGTIYRVELCMDENGNLNTKMCCFQGKVATTPVLPDGTSGEAVLVPAGSETTVHSDGTADDVRGIVYEELPEQAIENLRSMLENGQTMEGITLEELDKYIDRTTDSSETSGNSESEQAVLSDVEEKSGQDDADTDTDADVAENVFAQTGKSLKDIVLPKTQESTPAKAAEPAGGSSSDNKNTAADNSQSGNNGSDSANDNDQNNGGSNDDGSNDDGQDKGDPDKESPEEPSKPETYTVTFVYQGQTFATQTVKSGETASEPSLVPAQSGKWDFDFGTEIKANTTIKWQ